MKAPVTKSEKKKERHTLHGKPKLGSPLHGNLATFDPKFFKNYTCIILKHKTNMNFSYLLSSQF